MGPTKKPEAGANNGNANLNKTRRTAEIQQNLKTIQKLFTELGLLVADIRRRESPLQKVFPPPPPPNLENNFRVLRSSERVIHGAVGVGAGGVGVQGAADRIAAGIIALHGAVGGDAGQGAPGGLGGQGAPGGLGGQEAPGVVAVQGRAERLAAQAAAVEALLEAQRADVGDEEPFPLIDLTDDEGAEPGPNQVAPAAPNRQMIQVKVDVDAGQPQPGPAPRGLAVQDADDYPIVWVNGAGANLAIAGANPAAIAGANFAIAGRNPAVEGANMAVAVANPPVAGVNPAVAVANPAAVGANPVVAGPNGPMAEALTVERLRTSLVTLLHMLRLPTVCLPFVCQILKDCNGDVEATANKITKTQLDFYTMALKDDVRQLDQPNYPSRSLSLMNIPGIPATQFADPYDTAAYFIGLGVNAARR